MKRAAPTKPEDKKQVAREAAAKALDQRVTKLEGVSFDQVRSAVSEAVREAFPSKSEEGGGSCYNGPWVEDLFDDKVIFNNDGSLFSVGYSYADGKATLAGTPTQVMRTYSPVGSSATTANTGAPATPQEGAKAKRAELAKKIDATIGALAKKATPSKKKPTKSPFDNSPPGASDTKATTINEQAKGG